jgi:hypothetical protein
VLKLLLTLLKIVLFIKELHVGKAIQSSAAKTIRASANVSINPIYGVAIRVRVVD